MTMGEPNCSTKDQAPALHVVRISVNMQQSDESLYTTTWFENVRKVWEGVEGLSIYMKDGRKEFIGWRFLINYMQRPMTAEELKTKPSKVTRLKK